MTRAAAILAGALLLVWPAFVNGYPLVFSDTAALANMALAPDIGWDKPWVYGPFLAATSLRLTLWGPALAQALLVSIVLWHGQILLSLSRWRERAGVRVALAANNLQPAPLPPDPSAHGATSPTRHLLLCLVLAIGSTAPWFTALLMPDIFTPLVVLTLFLLAYGPPRFWLAALAALAIAVHLAHLVLAAACLAAILVLRPRRFLLCAAPLAAALAILLATNLVGNGVLGISPFGSVFALARLQADGPAADYLHAACPAAAPHFCTWSDRLPMDSDAFLWAPDGPLWADGTGPTRVAAEASRVVSATVAAYPGPVALAALRNTLRQLVMVRAGDALVPDYLKDTVGLLLRTYFPAEETRWFDASRQLAGTLPAVAAPLVPLHLALLAVGAAGTFAALAMGWRRRDPVLTGFAVMVLVGVIANAAATGALSGPHHRYQARIAWLLLLPPMALAATGLPRGPRRTAS